MPSPIQLKRPDVVNDARELALLTGVSVTDAVGTAVRQQLLVERVKGDSKLAKRRAAVEKIRAELRRLPIVGPTITDRDLYDEEGMPK